MHRFLLRLYGALTLLYPRRFRARWGEDIRRDTERLLLEEPGFAPEFLRRMPAQREMYEGTSLAAERLDATLAGIEAIHEDWKDGRKDPTAALAFEAEPDRTPTAITAFLVGLKKRTAIFRVQRSINKYREEPLLAILPGVALQELWDVMRLAEDALRFVAIVVVGTGILGMLVVILASLEARRREMAILRSVGATPLHVCGLFVTEAGVLSAATNAV